MAFSPEDRKEILAKIKDLIAGGEVTGKACQIAGISEGTYRTWLKAAKSAPARRKTPSMMTMTLPEPGSLGSSDRMKLVSQMLQFLNGAQA